MSYILAIDEGTTGTTALLVNKKNFEVIDKVNLEFTQHFPKSSWVEHDLNEIWDKIEESITKLIAKTKINPKEISGMGITNQRETTCAFTKDGVPLHHAIVWQDRRTSEFCAKNKKEFNEHYSKITGLPLDAYFSATKMNWLLNNSEEVQKAQTANNLLFGTIDTFILYKMTQGESFMTEPTNASRTLLMDLVTCNWKEELLSFFKIDKKTLPAIANSFSYFGETKGMSSLPDGIPITCILGDQQAALFGQAGFKEGDLKCTYGTGAFLLLNTGDKITYSESGLLTTVAYRLNGKTTYALEGSTYIAGAAVQWLRDNLKIVKTASEIEALANSVKDTSKMENILFFPFFTGIGTPYWNTDAKGAIIGLTRDTEHRHIARACLEGIALSIQDSIGAFIKDGAKLTSLKVDGGAAINNLLMNMQANFSKLKIIRPKILETTAYGVSLGALIGLKEVSLSDLKNVFKVDQEFMPEKDDSYFKRKKDIWLKYIGLNY